MPALPFLWPDWSSKPSRSSTRSGRPVEAIERQHAAKKRDYSAPSLRSIEERFISALVRAGECQRYKKSSSYGLRQTLPQMPLSPHTSKPLSSRRQFSITFRPRSQATAVAAYDVSKQELDGLIDQYVDYSHDVQEGTSKRLHRLVNNSPPSTLEPVVERPKNDAATLEILEKLRHQLTDPETPHDDIWQTYQDLPLPRAPRLQDKDLRRLFHHLSVVEYKSSISMSRYLSLVEDTRTAGIPLTAAQWTSAISFAGRFVKTITSTEVESAMQLWRQMEQQSGMQATSVTFNVLFDIATKARKFVLADMIMKEMQARHLPVTRFLRTSLIESCGLRGDGDGVRRAYKELVDADEIVDSVIITCVVKALLNCGEAVAAEQVFARAKRLHLDKTGAQLPPQDWRRRREIGRMLDAATRPREQIFSLRAQAEASAPLAPQLSTYKALIFHYAIEAGDLDRITELIYEMSYWGIPVHGSLYMYIFNGFARHGGVLYTAWSRRRLEQTWRSLVQGVEYEGGAWNGASTQRDTTTPSTSTPDHLDASKPTRQHTPTTTDLTTIESSASPRPPAPHTPNIYPTVRLTLLILRAFLKIAGPERTYDIWAEAQARWHIPDEDARDIEERLEAMMPDRDQSGRTERESLEGEVEGARGIGEWDMENDDRRKG